MRFLNRFSLNQKLLGSFSIIILLFLFVSIYSIKSMTGLSKTTSELNDNQIPSLHNVSEMHVNFVNAQRLIFRINSVTEQSEKDRLAGKEKAAVAALIEHKNEYLQSNMEEEEESIYNEFATMLSGYISILDRASTLSTAGKVEESEALISENNKTYTAIEELLSKLSDIQLATTDSHSSDAVSSSKTSSMVILGLSIFTIIFTIFIALVLTKQIKKALTNVSTNANDMLSSANEVRQSVRSAFSSVEVLDQSVQKTNQAVEEMVVSISQTAGNAENTASSVEQISAAIEEISKSINGVAQNAGSLNSSSEQASSAISELAVSIQQVSNNAKNVSAAAKEVQQDAIHGKSSIESTLEGMKDISHVISQATVVMKNLGKSSEEIGSIIEVIDDIADQTNLLALNAAIEAARAGDHGKGFAVVADEVRKLAERSAKATKEIALLIEGIQSESSHAISAIAKGTEKVDEGSKLAVDANAAILQIVESINNITQEINQITLATTEQASGTEQIVKAVEDVNSQANMVMQATREQSLSAAEIVKGISHAREQVQQITSATREQSQYGQEVAREMQIVSVQTKEVHRGAEDQSVKTDLIVKGVEDVVSEIEKLR